VLEHVLSTSDSETIDMQGGLTIIDLAAMLSHARFLASDHRTPSDSVVAI
jgi:hypothetical protein